MVSLVGATYESTDWGTWRNAVISLGLPTLCVTVTWALVRQANLKRRHSRTPDWKIIGEFTIFIWLYAVVFNLMSLWLFADITPQDNRVWSEIDPMIRILSIALAPSLWWFPIWTLISWWRLRRAAKRVGATEMHSEYQSRLSWFDRVKAAVSRDRPSNRFPWRLTGIVAAVLAGLAVLWCADQWVRSNELRALVEEMGSSHRSIERAEGNWTGSFQSAEDAGGTESDYGDAAASVKRSAQNLNVDLTLNLESLQSLVLLPWHGDNRALRDRYADYLNTNLKWTSDMGNSSSFETLIAAVNASSTPLNTTQRLLVEQAQSMPLPLFAQDLTNVIDEVTRFSP